MACHASKVWRTANKVFLFAVRLAYLTSARTLAAGETAEPDPLLSRKASKSQEKVKS
jgi:hypothetical protein